MKKGFKMNKYLIKLKQCLLLLKKYFGYHVNVDFYELEKLKQLMAKMTLNFFVSSLFLRFFFPDFLSPLAQALSILTYISLLVEIYLIVRF